MLNKPDEFMDSLLIEKLADIKQMTEQEYEELKSEFSELANAA